jgi:hypothetical protein
MALEELLSRTDGVRYPAFDVDLATGSGPLWPHYVYVAQVQAWAPPHYGGSTMSVKQFQVTFDCANSERVARFWCEVLGYVVPPPLDGFAT